MGTFEFLVSFNGAHLFATAEQTMSVAQSYATLKVLLDKFPENEGYEVVCLRWERTGSEFKLEELEG